MLFHSALEQDKIYAVTSQTKGKKVQIVWFKVNEYDNKPDHFWRTLVTSLASWDIHFSIAQRQKDYPESLLEKEQFMADIRQKLQDQYLVLSLINYQCITNKDINLFVDMLLQIENLHCALIYMENSFNSRQKAAIPNEKPQKQYYLSFNEEQQYYEKNNVTLSQAQLESIRYFTNGWPSAVELMVQLMNTYGEKLFENLKDSLIRWVQAAFVKYYTQPDLLRMICLSLLKEFPLELVQHLLKWSGESLGDVMDDSPIMRFNEQTRCYYFADFILPNIVERQVIISNKDRYDFLVQVGDWYNDHCLVMNAVDCYKKAGANQKILQAVSCWQFPVSTEVALCYISAISEMPEAFLEKHPVLHIIRGHMLCVLFRYTDIQVLMERFCQSYDQGEATPDEILSVLGEAYLLWGYACANLLAGEDTVLPLYRRAAELLPKGSAIFKGQFNIFTDTTIIRMPSPQAGSLEEYMAFLTKTEPYINTVTGGGWSGYVDFAAAEKHYYTRNFKAAAPYANKAITAAIENKQYHLAYSAYFLQMRLYFAKGNYEKTMQSFKELQRLVAENHDTMPFNVPDAAECWLYLKLGKKHKVTEKLKERNKIQNNLIFWHDRLYRMVYAFYLYVDRQYDSLIAYVDSSVDLLKKRGYTLITLYLLMMKAVALNRLEQHGKAVAVFEEIYQWSYKNNILMPIVEFGSHTCTLIEQCQKTPACSIPEEWLVQTAKKANSNYVYQYNMRKTYDQKNREADSLIEKLSGRERTLLALISQGKTVKEIAALQNKSPSGVKSAAQRLYAKLGAANRIEAIKIAVENNIDDFVSF